MSEKSLKKVLTIGGECHINHLADALRHQPLSEELSDEGKVLKL